MRIKLFQDYIKESVETTIETKNIAKPGDWIIRAKTEAEEEYVLRSNKFPKLYDINSAKSPSDKAISGLGFMEYNTIPEVRTGLICNRQILDELKSSGEGLSESKAITQKRMMEIIGEYENEFMECSKKKSAYARQVSEEEGDVDVVTRVKKGKPDEMWFVPSWGGTMPICEDDILIINSEEVYRIARAEFDQTYDI